LLHIKSDTNGKRQFPDTNFDTTNFYTLKVTQPEKDSSLIPILRSEKLRQHFNWMLQSLKLVAGIVE